jgi:Arc/MetJ-type ribon-helix-helix transcriptional regulator
MLRGRARGTLFHRQELAHIVSCVDLPWTCDLLLWVGKHLLPLRQPVDCARDRKKHREHLRFEAHGLVDDPGVKVHIGIQLALDEVVVFQRNPLQLQSDIQHWIAPRYLEYLLGRPLDNLGAWIVVLVNPVPKARIEGERASLYNEDQGDQGSCILLRFNRHACEPRQPVGYFILLVRCFERTVIAFATSKDRGRQGLMWLVLRAVIRYTQNHGGTMASPLTLRLDPKTRQRIARIARRRQVSISEVIREAIEAWAEQQEPIAAPYEAMADLIGVVHGGVRGRSTDMGQRFAELLKTRRSRK